jgi:hypothetical protein
LPPRTTKEAEKRREELRFETDRKVAEIRSRVRNEIHAFRPLGIASELSVAMGARPKRGVILGTPFGTYVFAKDRLPDDTTVERWRREVQAADETSREMTAMLMSIPSFRPNTTVGNAPGASFDRAVLLGLVSNEEADLAQRIQDFWRKHPTAKWGVWQKDRTIEPHKPAPEEAASDAAVAGAKRALAMATVGRQGWRDASAISPGARALGEKGQKNAVVRILLTREGGAVFRVTLFHPPQGGIAIPGVSKDTETAAEAVRIAEEHVR